MIKSINREIELRREYLNTTKLETIYFGGGTPSILKKGEFISIFNTIQKIYTLKENAEISVECNPDDLSKEKLTLLYNLGVNRLSIGIQSFKDIDLILMNRSHNKRQSLKSIKMAQKIGFKNISIDLIFSLPNQTLNSWKENLEIAFNLGIQHISCYSLTIEEKTKLFQLIKKGEISELDDISSSKQFKMLIEKSKEMGFIHYEISNFGKKGFFSKHNSYYWIGKRYLGIGPSAHSYNEESRQWNAANNKEYITNLSKDKTLFKIEYLTKNQKYNEYIFTSLRTIWGADINYIKKIFGKNYYIFLMRGIKKWIDSLDIIIKNKKITLTDKGKFISNTICSDLFIVR